MRAIARIIGTRLHRLWRRYRALRGWQQIAIAVVVVALLFTAGIMLRGKAADATPVALRAVRLEEVGNLAGGGSGSSVLGTVRSVTEASILAETGGTVRRVNASVGTVVPAGFVIAELENDSQRASVLQAEGAYDAAIAARASVSPMDSKVNAANAYRSAFTTLDTVLHNQTDLFFGSPTPFGPALLINPGAFTSESFSRQRSDIDHEMEAWRANLPSADSLDAETMLTDAETVVRSVQSFTEKLAQAANQSNSRATEAQIAALASSRASVSGILASLSAARTAYRSGSTSSTASVDAGVKAALGTLRLAEAALEKTLIRAPIGGTLNFLPLRVGDYVTALSHVATVAQNGALEIVAYVSEDQRAMLSVGEKVRVEDAIDGVITSIAPALDPVTKQIEIRVAVATASESGSAPALVNGQSVRIGVPGSPSIAGAGPVLLPLAAVKLRASDRVVFTVNADGELVATPIEIGDVRGDRVEVLTPLPSDLRIVTDARGLAEGERVQVSPLQ